MDQPHYFHDDHPVVLDEMYYKDMMRKFDPNWLPHKDYSPLVPFVRYEGYKGGTMRYFVPNRFNGWSTYIRFNEWGDNVNDRDYTPVEAARLLLWGANIRVHCGCPAYLFWGYNYILTQKDAAIVPETRFPTIRNPNLRGIACKHLVRTLKVLPFHLGDMARAVKQQRDTIDRGAK